VASESVRDATGGRVHLGGDGRGGGGGDDNNDERDSDENTADEKSKETTSGTADVNDAAAYARLQEVDPASAIRLHPNNSRRVRVPAPLPRPCHDARSISWTPRQWSDVRWSHVLAGVAPEPPAKPLSAGGRRRRLSPFE
jgi:hypothetical protein